MNGGLLNTDCHSIERRFLGINYPTSIPLVWEKIMKQFQSFHWKVLKDFCRLLNEREEDVGCSEHFHPISPPMILWCGWRTLLDAQNLYTLWHLCVCGCSLLCTISEQHGKALSAMIYKLARVRATELNFTICYNSWKRAKGFRSRKIWICIFFHLPILLHSFFAVQRCFFFHFLYSPTKNAFANKFLISPVSVYLPVS